MTDLQKQRLLELLADQTLFGLDDSELMEIEKLKKQFPDWEHDVSLELAAAAINLSQLEVNEELPADLRTKIFSLADDFFETAGESPKVLNFKPRDFGVVSPAAIENYPVRTTETKSSPWQWLGWAFAAAACVALVFSLLTRPNKTPDIAETPVPSPSVTVPSASPELSDRQRRELLLASAADVVRIPMTSAKNEKEIVGDIVWSNAEQKGYAHFTNLPVNDATKETYQLWIVDETRDAKTPLSGGVFSVNASGETIIPVNAQLPVKKPKVIAVTVEEPGGVVVSKPDRIVAVAKI